MQRHLYQPHEYINKFYSIYPYSRLKIYFAKNWKKQSISTKQIPYTDIAHNHHKTYQMKNIYLNLTYG